MWVVADVPQQLVHKAGLGVLPFLGTSCTLRTRQYSAMKWPVACRACCPACAWTQLQPSSLAPLVIKHSLSYSREIPESAKDQDTSICEQVLSVLPCVTRPA